MSYEYSSESKRLDFPNPFKVENYFYLVSAAILIVGAMMLLMLSRNNLAGNMTLWSITPLMVGVYLLLIGIRDAGRALMQLRFFFGRGEPASLAGDVAQDQTGQSREADELKEMLRQNALSLQEPKGALNGLLYSWLRDLIYAPHPIQVVAQRQFQTGLAILVTLLSFFVSQIGFADSASAAWLSLFYFGFTTFLLIRPLNYGAAGKADMGVKGLVVLILVAILGPVIVPLVSKHLPDIAWLSLGWQTFVLLLAALLAVGLYFVALMKQMVAPPPTTMACEQLTVSMNAHPKQLMDELDRELQKAWSEQIPNRRYSRVLPVVSGGRGSFAGDVVEETQPLPREDMRSIDLGACFSLPRYQWLAWLDTIGLLLTIAGVMLMVLFASRFTPTDFRQEVVSFATMGAALLLVSRFCFVAGHSLWGRFDFLSQLIWVELKGNYQSAKLDYGNQFTDRVRTEKEVINVETMTLRVWVAELESVSFGKNTQRYIVGMRGRPDKAQYLAHHLMQFAGDQSLIVAPTSNVDMQKVAALGAINKLGGGEANESIRNIQQAIAGVGAASSAKAHAHCSQCGASLEKEAIFCSSCGYRLGGFTSA